MSDTLKVAGASCPKCQADFCAEYAQLGAKARWTCNECGAGGELIGELSIRSKTEPAPASKPGGPTTHEHWRKPKA